MRKDKKKVIQLIEKETVDLSTGEIKSTQKDTTYFVDREPNFVKLYLDDVAKIACLNNRETNAFYQFVSQMSYNNLVPLTGPIRDIVMQSLNITEERTFERLIKSLKDKGILVPLTKIGKDGQTKVHRGFYLINPELVAKGQWVDIQRLRLAIDYTDGKRSISTEIVNKNGDINSIPINLPATKK